MYFRAVAVGKPWDACSKIIEKIGKGKTCFLGTVKLSSKDEM